MKVEFTWELFKNLFDAYDTILAEEKKIEDGITALMSEDTTVMYWKNSIALENFIVKFIAGCGETEEGAEWFFEQYFYLKEGKETEIDYDGKIYKIKNLKDYWDYLNDISEVK